MTDNDLSIKFGADLGDLDKVLASAAGSVDAFKKSIAGSVKIDTAGATASTQALERTLASASAGVKRSAAEIDAAFVGLSRHEWLNPSRQFQDVGVSLASGMNPLTIAIQQGSQIFDVFQAHAGGATAAMKSFG
ncbi:phage tail length tape measure family protein, partial [Methylosinus sp. R-45379]|uniref:phage tail length tape measure family protein n=1 Tax=Methylosinus sp. R-45379 TaxID=980563 RepID=UPI000A6F1159